MFNFTKNIIQQITLSTLQETLRVLSEAKLFCIYNLNFCLEPCILEQKSYESITVGTALLLIYHIQKYYFSNIPSMSNSLIVI